MISQRLLDFAAASAPVSRARQGDEGGSLAVDPILRTGNIEGVPHVAIDAVATDADGKSLLSLLQGMGLKQGSAWKGVVSGFMPFDAIAALASVPNLAVATASVFETLTGSVITQSDAALEAAAARASFGVDGTGVTIGVISDSFDTSLTASTTYAQDVASGDLPGDVVVLADGLGPSGVGDLDEGRAMMQLIHDIAPGANLIFHTSGPGQASFANAIDALVVAGADIIVDDIINLSEPRYQDGIIAQAAEAAIAAGVPFFSAIGNQGLANYTAPFDATTSAGVVKHDWDTGAGADGDLAIFIPAFTSFRLVLHWSEPYLSGTGGQSSGSASDLDLYAVTLDAAGQPQIIAGSADNNIGGDPIEAVTVSNFSSVGIAVDIIVELFDGPAPGEISITGFDVPGNNFVTVCWPNTRTASAVHRRLGMGRRTA